MAYEFVDTASYRLRLPADLDRLLGSFHAFTMPEDWPAIIREVYAAKRGKDAVDESWALPIGRVNKTLRALCPDVLYAGSQVTPSSTTPWLYARRPVDAETLKRIMQAYLQDDLSDEKDFPALLRAVDALDVSAHSDDWHLASFQSAQIDKSKAGTAVLDQFLYRLIPEVIAERILALDPIANDLRFHQVATPDGAELMSWPPLQHTTVNRNGESRVAHYSAVLGIQMRTRPFDPSPRLHLGVSIRRWVTDKLYIPDKSVSTYIKPHLDPLRGRTRFAVAPLRYMGGDQPPAWGMNGNARMLNRLLVGADFPDPAVMSTDAGAYLSPTADIQAGTNHHTQMGWHDVETGVMPDERRHILTWASQALPEDFEPAIALEQTPLGRLNLEPQILARKKVPTEPRKPKAKRAPDDSAATQAHLEKVAKYEEALRAHPERRDLAISENERIDAHNSARHRHILARGMEGEELRVHVLTQTDDVRDALVAAAAHWLGLAPEVVHDHPGHILFQDDELKVRVICEPAGQLASALGGGAVPARGEAHQKAINERAELVRKHFEDQEFMSEAAIVEIQPRSAFKKRRTDPKWAIRQGAARAKRVTQFITTPGDTKDADRLPFKALASWEDTIRSQGIGLVPERHPDINIPDDLDQAAIWLVRRNVSKTNGSSIFMPIAVLLNPNNPRVLARTAEETDWLPYNEVLCRLAASPPKTEEQRSEAVQRDELGRFIRTSMQRLKGRPALLLTDASNVRSLWKWATDKDIEIDRFSPNETASTPLAAFNQKLRVVRVRTESDRLETPQWWARPSAKEDAEPGPAGFTYGLWQECEATPDNRVFFSLAPKNPKLQTHHRGLRKFIRIGADGLHPDAAAPVPRILEIAVAGLAKGDEPETAAHWAMFVHHQRFTASYPDGLEYPYALSLCQRAASFAFPNAEVTNEPDPEDDQLALF
ncbi:pPIWI_RE module domain-containing protein [Nocardioides sp. WG-D5]